MSYSRHFLSWLDPVRKGVTGMFQALMGAKPDTASRTAPAPAASAAEQTPHVHDHASADAHAPAVGTPEPLLQGSADQSGGHPTSVASTPPAAPEPDTRSAAPEEPHLNELTVPKLRALAKQRGLTGYSSLRKAELIALLEAEQ